ncbi:MAG: FimV/HubP family polar landmark protein [Methylophilaceae bacterium]
MSKIKQISIAVCLALTPISIYAAGLGKLNTQSALGEPLRAEIEVSATPAELASLAASIASEEVFVAQGVTRLGIHNQIKVDLSKNAAGKSVLKLRSLEPVKDPYLDLIIQMDWQGGQLQREYTLLLDPPSYKATDVNSVEAAVHSPEASASNAMEPVAAAPVEVKKSSVKKLRKYKKRSVRPKIDMSVEVSADAAEATTKRGDTLTSIANEMQVEGVSLDQMLAGLYKANQGAFVKGNINRLKIGEILKVPTKESLASINNVQAMQVVRVHSNNWNAYRNTMANAVAKANATSEMEDKQASSGKITTAEDKAAAVKTGSQDVVKLSSGKTANKDANGKLIALQEETAAHEKSLKEGQERAAQLESQIKDMKKVLELKNQSMADKQNAAVVGTAPEVKPTDVKPESVSPTEVKPVDSTTAVSGAVPTEVKVEEPKPVPVEKYTAKPVPPVVTPIEEPSFLDGLFGGDNNLPLIGGGLGLGLLGAGWMFLRNKRKKNLDSFERGILTSGGLRANTVFGNTTSNTSTSDTSFLTDFAQSVDGGMIDTNDVDPIAEAEVYMAYGRGAQAEEILKDAIAKEPKRYELHLKLLEIYVENKDAASFETIAGELYTTLGADDPVWAKVATLGAKLEPENPLYDLSKITMATAAATAVATEVHGLDNDLDFSSASASPSLSTPKVNTLVDDNSLDFSLDDGHEAAINAAQSVESIDFSPAEKANEIDFSEFKDDDVLDIGASAATGFIPVAVAATAHLDDSNLMDFDIGEKLDVSDSMSKFEFSDSVTAKSELVSNPLDITVDASPTEPLDFAMDFDLPSTTKVDAPVIDITKTMETASDFSFELPAENLPVVNLTETTNAIELPKTTEPVANSYDLSAINLNLDIPTLQPNLEKHNSLGQNSVMGLDTPTKSGAEPPDVEIKLDLVAVYMDMDDKVGARELLEEVIKEGGTMQIQRAQKLLASLT